MGQQLCLLSKNKNTYRCQEFKIQGILKYKEWETINRWPRNRSWRKLYCAVSSENTFEIFKDRRHFENGNQPLESFDLLGLKNIQIENDYKKKENVFRLSFLNGICYLVCAQDKNQMYSWIRQIQAGLERVNYGLLTLSAYNQIVTLRLQSSDYNHLIKNFHRSHICIDKLLPEISTNPNTLVQEIINS